MGVVRMWLYWFVVNVCVVNKILYQFLKKFLKLSSL